VGRHYAAAWGYEVVVEQLMAGGADPTADNMEALTAAQLARNRGHNESAAVIDKWVDAR
jgi:hypothetical protein